MLFPLTTVNVNTMTRPYATTTVVLLSLIVTAKDDGAYRVLFFYRSINQSKRIYIAPYVAGESEARVGLG